MYIYMNLDTMTYDSDSEYISSDDENYKKNINNIPIIVQNNNPIIVQNNNPIIVQNNIIPPNVNPQKRIIRSILLRRR